MPPRPGEKLLLTIFADVHYFFSPPKQRPSHHRFETGSYVYIHHDQGSNTGRVEAANNPGTPEQDAVEGSLTNSSLSYSHKHPCLLSFTIHHPQQHHLSNPRPWHLSAFDLSHQNQYLYPLHAVDLYFWTASDAQNFLALAKQLQPASCDERDAPSNQQGLHQHQTSAESTNMSPVVQKLEQVAIASPFPQHGVHGSQDQHQHNQYYQQQQQAQGRSSATSTPYSQSVPPPPPQQQPSPHTGINAGSSGYSSPPPPPPVAAYNPAAPAAPEPHAHREKTPPPEDHAPPGQPVMSYGSTSQYAPGQPAMYAQHPQPFTPQPTSPPAHPGIRQTNSFPPPPPQQQTPYGATQSQTFSPPPSAGLPPQPQPHRQSSLPFQQYASPPPPQSPAYPPAHTSSPPQPQPYNPASPTASSFAGPQSPPPQQGAVPLPSSIHAQAYQPSEQEMANRKHNEVAPGYGQGQTGPGQAPGRMEARGAKVEKGVNKLFKRLDRFV